MGQEAFDFTELLCAKQLFTVRGGIVTPGDLSLIFLTTYILNGRIETYLICEVFM